MSKHPVPPEVWVTVTPGGRLIAAYTSPLDAVVRAGDALKCVPVHGAPTPDPLPEGVVRGLVLPAGVEPPEGVKVWGDDGWYVPSRRFDVVAFPRVVRLVEPPAPTPERVPLNESLGRTHADGWVIGALLLLDGEPIAADDGDMGVFTHASFDGMVSVLPLEGEA